MRASNVECSYVCVWCVSLYDKLPTVCTCSYINPFACTVQETSLYNPFCKPILYIVMWSVFTVFIYTVYILYCTCLCMHVCSFLCMLHKDGRNNYFFCHFDDVYSWWYFPIYIKIRCYSSPFLTIGNLVKTGLIFFPLEGWFESLNHFSEVQQSMAEQNTVINKKLLNPPLHRG